jgi:hypothetical protein
MSGNGPTTELATMSPRTTFSLTPTSLEEALRLADLMAKSDLVPKEYKDKPANVLIAVAMGAEVGLSPMQALQTIAVIGGRPTLWGDGLLGLVQAHPDYEWHDENQSTEIMGVCTIKRKGAPPHTSTFSKEDASRAGLWNKSGPWQQYPMRMLKLRARAFALRDQFSDAIRGLTSAEEAIDIAEMIPIDESPQMTKREALLTKLKEQVQHEPSPPAAPSATSGKGPVEQPGGGEAGEATGNPPASPPPAPSDLREADQRILYQDRLRDIEAATTVAERSRAVNLALDDLRLTAGQHSAIRKGFAEWMAKQPGGKAKRA